MNAKLIYALIAIVFISTASYIYAVHNTKASAEELAIQALLSEQKAKEDRYFADKAKFEECLSKHTAQDNRFFSGSTFEVDQKRAYECFKTNTWTANLTPVSEVPPKWSITIETNANIQGNLLGNDKKVPIHTDQILTTPQLENSKVWVGNEENQWSWTQKLSQSSWTGVQKWENGTPKEESTTKVVKTTLRYSLDIIKSFECPNWPHLVAYADWPWYTIGCGTRSYAWERISESEAYARLTTITQKLVTRIQSDFPTLKPNQQWALVSLAFNCETCYQAMKKYGVSMTRWRSYKYGWIRKKDGSSARIYMRWLEKRREAEITLYNQ